MSDYEEYETTNQSVDLTSFDDDFATAEAPEYDEVPDGKYQARIESVKLESSQKGDPMIKFDLEVLSGSCRSSHLQELGHHASIDPLCERRSEDVGSGAFQIQRTVRAT
jgi:hypothetical protein